MKRRARYFAEIDVQCAVCGRFSQTFTVPTDESGTTCASSASINAYDAALKATGYLTVRLYDDTKPLCCRECAENLLGRRTAEQEEEMPY